MTLSTPEERRCTALIDLFVRLLQATHLHIAREPDQSVRVGALMGVMASAATLTFVELTNERDPDFAQTAMVSAFQAVKEQLESMKERK
jgi:hypothetical protein